MDELTPKDDLVKIIDDFRELVIYLVLFLACTGLAIWHPWM